MAASATASRSSTVCRRPPPHGRRDTYRAQYSQNYQGTLPVEGDVVVPSTNIDGCQAFSADEAAR